MRSWTLAVDFGTSFTTAAVRVDGRVEMLEVENSRYLPSLVMVEEDGQIVVGRHAVNRAAMFPERVERTPKRALATGPAVRLGGRDVATVDLVAAVLGKVFEEAVRRYGRASLKQVVLTHPARWTGGALDLLGQAAAKAGMPEPAFVSEPVAAATYYAAHERVAVGKCVAVYDLGGGTFDTAVLRRTGDGFALAGPPGGNSRLGGEDLDAVLLELVGDHASSLDAEAWEKLMFGEDRVQARGRMRLRSDVTEAKHALSERPAAFVLPDGFDNDVRVTRLEFEQRITDLLRQSVGELLATIARAGLDPSQLAAIHLTGGSSRIPKISDLLSETLGFLPVVEGDPKTVVVLGALRSLDGPEERSPRNTGAAARSPAARSGPAPGAHWAPKAYEKKYTRIAGIGLTWLGVSLLGVFMGVFGEMIRQYAPDHYDPPRPYEFDGGFAFGAFFLCALCMSVVPLAPRFAGRPNALSMAAVLILLALGGLSSGDDGMAPIMMLLLPGVLICVISLRMSGTVGRSMRQHWEAVGRLAGAASAVWFLQLLIAWLAVDGPGAHFMEQLWLPGSIGLAAGAVVLGYLIGDDEVRETIRSRLEGTAGAG